MSSRAPTSSTIRRSALVFDNGAVGVHHTDSHLLQRDIVRDIKRHRVSSWIGKPQPIGRVASMTVSLKLVRKAAGRPWPAPSATVPPPDRRETARNQSAAPAVPLGRPPADNAFSRNGLAATRPRRIKGGGTPNRLDTGAAGSDRPRRGNHRALRHIRRRGDRARHRGRRRSTKATSAASRTTSPFVASDRSLWAGWPQ
jgi:hypothetical protein